MTGVPVLETFRLTLRGWREDDIAPLTAILSDPQVTRYLFGDGRQLTAEEAREAYGRRIASWENDGVGFWAVELRATGRLIGWAGLQVARFESGLEGVIEVGWTLGREWWGNGYAKEAAEASVRWGFEHRGLERIYAFHAPANRRSERVMEGLGMRAAGTTTDVRDGAVSGVRVITLEDWEARGNHSEIPNPHKDPTMLARVLGYDVDPAFGALTLLEPAPLREALLGAIARTWPGPELRGEPRAYVVGLDDDIAVTMLRDRGAGLVPLLVSVEISSAEEAGTRLAELYVATLREGVWLHTDVQARHGLELEGLEHADSVAFDVPAHDGRRRVFVTRHPDMLDDAFAAALGTTGGGNGIG